VSGEPEAKSDTDHTTICDMHNAYHIHITKIWRPVHLELARLL